MCFSLCSIVIVPLFLLYRFAIMVVCHTLFWRKISIHSVECLALNVDLGTEAGMSCVGGGEGRRGSLFFVEAGGEQARAGGADLGQPGQPSAVSVSWS